MKSNQEQLVEELRYRARQERIDGQYWNWPLNLIPFWKLWNEFSRSNEKMRPEEKQ